ncbi:unnamed protein product [Pylaiella littoralis]
MWQVIDAINKTPAVGPANGGGVRSGCRQMQGTEHQRRVRSCGGRCGWFVRQMQEGRWSEAF